MELLPADAARRGAGVQSVRFREGRPRPMGRAFLVRRSDIAARCARAREHRDSRVRVLLTMPFTWLNKQGVRSSDGFEFQFTGRFSAEYRDHGVVTPLYCEGGGG